MNYICNKNTSERKIQLQAMPAVKDPIDEFLLNEFGIANVMSYEFDDLKTKDSSDFIFSNVRGSVPLLQGKIRTFKESQEIVHRAAKIDFKSLLKYRT